VNKKSIFPNSRNRASFDLGEIGKYQRIRHKLHTNFTKMCIFSGEVTHVSSTKIMAGMVYPVEVVNGRRLANEGKPLQLLIYSNQVGFQRASSLEQSLELPHTAQYIPAMILPFPLRAGKNRVAILDMSNYRELFDDLGLLFPSEGTRSAVGGLLTNSYDDEEAATPIEVKYVGSYRASIVPNLRAFDRLQHSEFGLAPDCHQLLAQYYSRDYGFIVCQLTSERGNQYHPFAYVHEPREDGKLFIPTRHYHRGTRMSPYFKYQSVDDREQIEEVQDLRNHFERTLALEDRWLQINAKKNKMDDAGASADDWDHEIYIFNRPTTMRHALFLNKPGVTVHACDSETLRHFGSYVDLARFPQQIAFRRPAHIARVKIDGGYKYNLDLLV
jgi:hypothetical protein